MENIIFRKMKERLDIDREDSDASFFNTSLLYGELLVKYATSILISGIANGVQRHRYSCEYRLIRADGLGEWCDCLRDITVGPKSTCIISEAQPVFEEFTRKYDSESWQHSALGQLYDAMDILDLPHEKSTNGKIQLIKWFDEFAKIRNKTRGHGATMLATCAKAAGPLMSSINQIEHNLAIFKLDSAFLHENINGHYRISRIAGDDNSFSEFKAKNPERKKLKDGVYTIFSQSSRPKLNTLLFSDSDLSYFRFPNGAAHGKIYDTLSYIDGKTHRLPLEPEFSIPPTELPPSDTYGLNEIDIQGYVYGNIPPRPNNYIRRDALELQLKELILDDRNPVISLTGMGGIGKTSLIISVLHDLIERNDLPYSMVLWFSARDVDLHEDGPRSVRAAVLTEEDISKYYVKIVEPDETFGKNGERSCLEFFQDEMREKYENKGKLYIFDNFETVSDPGSLYAWLNTYIRLPNKIVITTRHRDFKSDYPVEVTGMMAKEARELINELCKKFSIEKYFGDRETAKLIDISSGHPYIIKIYLGKLSMSNRRDMIQSVIREREDVLTALFNRTYEELTELEKRVYLTLCKWNTPIPEIGIKAIISHSQEKGYNYTANDISDSIKKITNYSLIESIKTGDGNSFSLSVPFASMLFGQSKLKTSQYRFMIENDVKLLQYFGSTTQPGSLIDFKRRISRFLNEMSMLALKNDDHNIAQYSSIVEYIAQSYNEAWIIAADAIRDDDRFADEALKFYESYIESHDTKPDAISACWEKISKINRRKNNYARYIFSLANYAVSLLSVEDKDYKDASRCASSVNSYISEHRNDVDTENANHILIHLAQVLAGKIDVADADDCSRIAWLYIHAGDLAEGRRFAAIGLQRDSENEHCKNIMLKSEW